MSNSILWRRLDLPGHEIARLRPRGEGWELSGTAVFAGEMGPCRLDYAVICDAGWRTSSARVQGTIGDREVDLAVDVDAARNWRLNGEECPAVAGALDIDLGFSPSTNTLPIRRLALAVGTEAEVQAAWLPFPALAFEPLAQVYRREGVTAYRYESQGGRFTRTLEVDAAGFVIRYPGLWETEAGPR
jgi:hypothetical protein